MARKVRLEEAGGLYHVINRGNYRRWIFEEGGARDAFEATLWEACERAKWVLHGYCIMGNHYHLALETQEGNLSEGMRWLQSVYANRFNRYRQEGGHLFQGRYKSLIVENRERLGWLCHYIHLNPVRAKICPVEELAAYRWSSYWHLQRPKDRPARLNLNACLEGAGGLEDTPAGRRKYTEYLAWLSANAPAQRELAFAKMSRGWAIGGETFKRDLIEDEQRERLVIKQTQAEAREVRQARWTAAVEKGMQRLGKTERDVRDDAKAADWKVALAADLKKRLMCTNRWLGERLNMGPPAAVCRYVSEALSGRRQQAYEYLKRVMD